MTSYSSREAYLEAPADAMQPEYDAIPAVGLELQLDCPDLGLSRHVLFGARFLQYHGEHRRGVQNG